MFKLKFVVDKSRKCACIYYIELKQLICSLTEPIPLHGKASYMTAIFDLEPSILPSKLLHFYRLHHILSHSFLADWDSGSKY